MKMLSFRSSEWDSCGYLVQGASPLRPRGAPLVCRTFPMDQQVPSHAFAIFIAFPASINDNYSF